MDVDLKSLHPLEIKLLLHAGASPFTSEDLERELSFVPGQANQAFNWLSAKGLIVEVERKKRTFYELTDLGKQYAEAGTPEKRIYTYLQQEGSTTLPDLAAALNLENKDIGSAFGLLSKEGVAAMGPDKKVEKTADWETSALLVASNDICTKFTGNQLGGLVFTLEQSKLSPMQATAAQSMSKKRGAASSPFKLIEREDVSYTLTDAGREVKKALRESGGAGGEIGQLTQEMLASGQWKNASFRSYNIQSPPVRVVIGRRNPYCEFLDSVKDKLVSLGFEEFDGPIVETEFWNSDALFMPQFHSARDIHDVYYVKEPTHAKEIEQPYLDQVAASHENGWKTGSSGWGYDFDRDFTRRLILRSQGTVLSAKTLPKASVPGKYFGTVRCFRYDQVDATHLADFYQTEGIVLGEDVNLRTLLGLLKMFAEEVAGAEEVQYVPGYFPFTEPSVEVHIKHPVLGWFELGGSGIFRPEVTEPLGIKVPVLAWGLGIDRMALMSLGLSDLRELFSLNIENVRLRRNAAARRKN